MVFRFAVLLALVSIIFGSPLEYSYAPEQQHYVHAYEVPSKGPPAPAPAPAPAPKPAPALPVHKHLLEHHEYEHEGPVEYEFSYTVEDDHTKDIKGQKESRKGDSVKGHYELVDSDGYKRVVEYTADDKNGFQAIVHREKVDIVVPIQEPKVHKGPTQHYEHGPEPLYHAPTLIQHYYHAPAPTHHHYSPPPLTPPPSQPETKFIFTAPAPAPAPAPSPKPSPTPTAFVAKYIHSLPVAKVEPPVNKTAPAPAPVPVPVPVALAKPTVLPSPPAVPAPEQDGSHVSYNINGVSYHY